MKAFYGIQRKWVPVNEICGVAATFKIKNQRVTWVLDVPYEKKAREVGEKNKIF